MKNHWLKKDKEEYNIEYGRTLAFSGGHEGLYKVLSKTPNDVDFRRHINHPSCSVRDWISFVFHGSDNYPSLDILQDLCLLVEHQKMIGPEQKSKATVLPDINITANIDWLYSPTGGSINQIRTYQLTGARGQVCDSSSFGCVCLTFYFDCISIGELNISMN